MNADLQRLVDNLRINLPGALDGTIQNEIFAALTDFLQTTNVWTEDIDFAVTAGVQKYTIVPSRIAAINRLMGAVNSDGRSISVLMKVPGDLYLMDVPNKSATYTAQVALTVTDPTARDGYPDLPTWIINKYGSDLFEGVVGRMMGQPAKPYSNERLAIFHMRRFEASMSKAKVEAQHRNVYRGQSWRFPQTFASRNWR